MTNSVDYNGVVPEKFDVVKLSHLVDAEYGNQGLDFKLLNREGFAWTNCAYRPARSCCAMLTCSFDTLTPQQPLSRSVCTS